MQGRYRWLVESRINGKRIRKYFKRGEKSEAVRYQEELFRQANEGIWSVTITNSEGIFQQDFECRLYVDSLVVHELPDPIHPGVAAGGGFSLETRPTPFLPHEFSQSSVSATFPLKENS